MNVYINTNTNVCPYHIGNLQFDYPEYNVYQPLPEGVFPIEWSVQPEAPDIAHYYEINPIAVDGIWKIEWVLTERKPGTYKPGPDYSFDEESNIWYPSHPLAIIQND